MQPALTPFVFANGNQPAWPANSDRPEGSPALYGFGWFLDPYKNHPRMWHYGETQGFRSYIVRFTKNNAATNDALAGTTIIILCNRTDLTPNPKPSKSPTSVFQLMKSLRLRSARFQLHNYRNTEGAAP